MIVPSIRIMIADGVMATLMYLPALDCLYGSRLANLISKNETIIGGTTPTISPATSLRRQNR